MSSEANELRSDIEALETQLEDTQGVEDALAERDEQIQEQLDLNAEKASEIETLKHALNNIQLIIDDNQQNQEFIV